MLRLLTLYKQVPLLLAPVLSIVCLLHPRLRTRARERFGFWNLPPGEYVWIHGASAGELKGLTRLIPWVRKRYPDVPILITSFSAAGVGAFGSLGDFARILPFDSSHFFRRALWGVSIKIFLFGETEIWPALIDELGKRGVPIALVNGRVEEKSFQFYSSWRTLFHEPLGYISFFGVTSEETKERLLKLGVDLTKISVLGNTKYDYQPKHDSSSGRKCEGRKVITLGSIHPGEEEWWFDEIVRRKEVSAMGDLLLIVAPRHLEKIRYFTEQLERRGIRFLLSSKTKGEISSDIPLLLVDSFGELESYYAISRLAFIGGTLTPIGGHNPFEPLPYSVPICLGPHTFRIRQEVDDLKGCISHIAGRSDIARLFDFVLQDSEELQCQGQRGKEVWETSLGSVARYEELLDRTFLKSVTGGRDTTVNNSIRL